MEQTTQNQCMLSIPMVIEKQQGILQEWKLMN